MSKESIIKEAVREFESRKFSVPIGEGSFVGLVCPDCSEQRFCCVRCTADWLTSKLSEVYDKGRESATSNYFITSGIEEGRAQIQDEIKKVLGIES